MSAGRAAPPVRSTDTGTGHHTFMDKMQGIVMDKMRGIIMERMRGIVMERAQGMAGMVAYPDMAGAPARHYAVSTAQRLPPSPLRKAL